MSEFAGQLLFATGGGLGAVARHAVTRLVAHRLPLSTLVVNVAGSLVLGVVLGWLARHGAGVPGTGTRLIIGFCGGFTTFSSFAYQSLELNRLHTLVHAAGNIALNLGICLLVFGIARTLPWPG